jgi:hypothetical protein
VITCCNYAKCKVDDSRAHGALMLMIPIFAQEAQISRAEPMRATGVVLEALQPSATTAT